jgi:hypothetical protein
MPDACSKYAHRYRLEVDHMGLLKRIDEALGTARHSQTLAARYAVRTSQELADGLIVADRSASDNSPANAA